MHLILEYQGPVASDTAVFQQYVCFYFGKMGSVFACINIVRNILTILQENLSYYAEKIETVRIFRFMKMFSNSEDNTVTLDTTPLQKMAV